uniref:Uncharacterized protein n=1 Tax=Sinocyclocheilus rhinocerous TaxID=307959 RepID=A0A673GUJ3_9TELE
MKFDISYTVSKLKCWDLKGSEDITEPAGSSSGNDQGGMDTSPTTTEKTSPTELQMDLVDAEQLCVSGPICPKTEHQVKTELSILQMYIPQSAIQLQDRLEQCTLDWTPITKVWCNVFIGNEKTAKDRAKLKEMGITHILNATANEEDLHGKISSREEYYQGMSITYYNVPAVDEDWFNISEYFFPAAEFIHKALSNPENKLLVHCIHGVSRSSTLVLAYLMIHHNMMVEDAIDHVTDERWIGPNVGFLNQLTVLNSDLVKQRKIQLRKQLDKYKKTRKTELLLLKKHILQNMIQLKQCLEKCALDWTPVTEVWPNVFIGNEETAIDRAKLKEMVITHILNAAALKKNLRVLLGMPRKKDLEGTISTGAKYYKGMNIAYYGVPVIDDHLFDISKYFYPAAKFIHQALSNPENTVLVHCIDAVRRSPTLFLAYLMIHHDMMVEDAIDHVIKVRRIRPNIGFLKQLTILNSELVSQRKLQFKTRQTEIKCTDK